MNISKTSLGHICISFDESFQGYDEKTIYITEDQLECLAKLIRSPYRRLNQDKVGRYHFAQNTHKQASKCVFSTLLRF